MGGLRSTRLWFCLIVILTIEGSQYLAETDIYAFVDSTVILNCSFMPNNSTVQWMHVDKQIVFSEGIQTNPQLDRVRNSSKIDIKGNHENGEYNLAIYNLQNSDSGQYRCDANIDGKAASETFNLHVFGDDITLGQNMSSPTNQTGFLLYEAVFVYGFMIVGICTLPWMTVIVVREIRKHSERKQNNIMSDVGEENTAPEHHYESVYQISISDDIQHDRNNAVQHTYEHLQDYSNSTIRYYDICAEQTT